MTDRQGTAHAPAGSERRDEAALEQLRELLLGEEQEQIEHLVERIENPSLRTEDVADVLPDAVALADARGEALTEAMRAPVTRCIEQSVRENPDGFAGALYPVMGPAIRQSIVQTLRGLVENINRTLEHSLSIRGLRWRLEAMRDGLPFAEVVLRHTLIYRVEQVFLIQPETGLPMLHVADDPAVEGDADAISGMLTAITQFVRDAFRADRTQELDTIEHGEHTVILVHGPQAYLAAVVRGIPPVELREHCQEVLERLHARHGERLQDFDGRPETLEPARALLSRCLRSQQRESETARRGLSPAFRIVLLALFLLLAWWAWTLWQDHREREEWQQIELAAYLGLSGRPGIVVLETRPGFPLELRLMRDPIAPPVPSLLEPLGLTGAEYRIEEIPYLDLSPPIVLERARRSLAPPPRVTLALDGTTLVADGVAPADWIERLRLLAPLLPGIDRVDERALRSLDDDLAARARERLAPLPDGITLAVRDGVLRLEGIAPLDWIEAIDARLHGLDELRGVERALQSQEQRRFDILRAQIESGAIYFEEGARLAPDQAAQLRILAGDLRELFALGERLGRPVRVRVVGRTDGIGPRARNERLGLERARTVIEGLVAAGTPEARLEAVSRVEPTPVFDPLLRRTEFRILLDEGG